ncbi:MAG: hypothetical protein RL308_344 [Bacteroidota bacterium]|jgi:hypothetical protein
MSLFQKTVIKKHLLELNNIQIDSAYKRFTEYFHNFTIQKNIREAKEEQFQEGFLRELFGHIMGYTLNPNPDFNLTTELKNTTNSKKADGAILIDGKAIAVIELKGTETTDLNKIEVQAFGYKNNQSECAYVITSNFEKLRFYIDNTIDFEEFNLFTLNRDQFNLLYLCLSYENIKNNIPKRLKAESVSQEDQITKKLYKDYSEFKRALFDNLVQLNPNYDKLLLFKKTQKLLDRFLFIFFAEDRLLLPTNLIFRINQEWKNLQAMRIPVSLYERYMVYFNDLNHGAIVTLPAFGKKTGEAITAEFEIFAYNGGLFIPDEVLDNVKIDDAVLHTYSEKLSHYDFDSDVDVNILGHIFENSLNEIDEIKSEIEGEIIDKTKTRRKKDGVFYTPKYITKYIVDNTVGKLCTERKTELKLNDEDYINDKKIQTKTKKSLLDKISDYRNWLLELTICDPACGSGAFLNQALEFLIAEHKYVDELQAKLMGDSLILSDVENSILENNIYGVDLNDESVEIAKLSLWLRTAQKGRKLNSLNNNIKCGNSLIDEVAVAGDKAFSWEEEFPEVFEKGGFDVVIGNPPYVQHRNLFQFSSYFKKTYKVYTGTSDLSVYFFEKGLDILKKNGELGYINTNKFFNSEYGIPLRNLLAKMTINQIVNFEQVAIFEGALVSSVMITITKALPSKSNVILMEFQKESMSAEKFDCKLLMNRRKVERTQLTDTPWLFEKNENISIINKIKAKGVQFGDIKELKINRGITTGYDDAYIISQDLFNQFIKKDENNSRILKPILKGKDIKRYTIDDSKLWIINAHNGLSNRIEKVNLENDFPYLYEHINSINILSNGKVENRSDKGKHWSNLRSCAFLEEFEKEKIVWGLITGNWNFAIDKKGNYLSSASYFLTTDKFPLNFIIGLLNSRLYKFYFEIIGEQTAGGAYVLKKTSVEKFVLPTVNLDEQKELIDKVDLITQIMESINNASQMFLSLLISKYNFESVSTKLQIWYNLEFKGFDKELNKIGVKLTLPEELEWLKFFNDQKSKISILLERCNKTDKEIDQMVYKLYELTAEEIKIVEGA